MNLLLDRLIDRVFRYRIHKEVNAISFGFEAGGFGRTGRHWGHPPWKTLLIWRIERRLYSKRTSLTGEWSPSPTRDAISELSAAIEPRRRFPGHRQRAGKGVRPDHQLP
jgi:hypothetical protein